MTAPFDERFDAPELDPALWIDHYLPQWTTPERSRARYSTGDGLTLRIEADQPHWREEDAPMRVSSIQTAVFSGEAGSERGTHRHAPGLVVRTRVEARTLWAPAGSGSVEAAMSASHDPDCMLAIWLVGVEDLSPDDSGEITVAELFGDAVRPGNSTVRLGVKAVNDPRLHTDVVDLHLPFDASETHTYGAEWDETGIRFVVDGEIVHTSEQRLGYALQLMIDLFELRPSREAGPMAYPKTATVAWVRGGSSGRGVS